MALKSVYVSDLTGAEADESELCKLTIKKHPDLDEPKALDCLSGELDGLKVANNLVVVEITSPDGAKRQMACSLSDFKKVVSDSALSNARSTRGRRAGWSPKK